MYKRKHTDVRFERTQERERKRQADKHTHTHTHIEGETHEENSVQIWQMIRACLEKKMKG